MLNLTYFLFMLKLPFFIFWKHKLILPEVYGDGKATVMAQDTILAITPEPFALFNGDFDVLFPSKIYLYICI